MTCIVCCGLNNEIGKDNKLLFNFPEDKRMFKSITMGMDDEPTAVIMGSKTFDSIGKPLPFRYNIVLTRSDRYEGKEYENTKFVSSIADALNTAIEKGVPYTNLFLIGGAQVYKENLYLCDRVILTRVLKEAPDADAFFPDLKENGFLLHSNSDEMISNLSDTGEEIGYDIEFYVRERQDSVVEA